MGPVALAHTGELWLHLAHRNVTVGTVDGGGNLDARLSYGEFEVGTALASVDAKSAYGGIRMREVCSGSVQRAGA